MTHLQQAQLTRNSGFCAFLVDNAADYSADIAFTEAATEMKTDSALAVIAGNDTAADNTGYSKDKVVAKTVASDLAAMLCSSCQVKLNKLGNHALSDALNGNATFYFKAGDNLAGNRLMNVYAIMHDNMALITVDYVTAAQLATLLTNITTFSTMQGTTTMVNTNSPVLTQVLQDCLDKTSADVLVIKQLLKKFKLTNPVFYNGVLRASKLPAISIRHTTISVIVTNADTGEVEPDVAGTLTKSKEVPVSNFEGVMEYTKVLAGTAMATFAKDGFITSLLPMTVVRGRLNTFTIALTPGEMTTEQEEAIKNTMAKIIAANKAIAAKRKKARKGAKANTAVANVTAKVAAVKKKRV